MELAQKVFCVFNPNKYLDKIFKDEESVKEYISQQGAIGELFTWRAEIPCYWTEDGPEL